jgi:hypothetical protein
MVGACGALRSKESTVFWVENLKERLCEGCRHRWEDNIKMGIKEIDGVCVLD